MAGHEQFVGMIIGYVGIAFAFLYISFNVKKEQVPRGRIFEKVLYYVMGLITLFAISINLVLTAENVNDLSYLESATNAYFTVSTTIILVMFFFYMYYMLRQSIISFKEVRNKEDKNNEYDL